MDIVLLGSGNVATHLATALKAAGENIVQVFSPDLEHARQLAGILETTAVNQLAEIDLHAGLYVIAVADRAIAGIAAGLKNVDGLVVHTSGTTDIKVISSVVSKAGVLYPLQTFSKAKELNFKNVPLCIEASNPEQLDILKKLAGRLGSKIYEINGEKRKVLHLAAVFACNFTNYLYSAANSLLQENNLDFNIIRPLITETANKVMTDLPENVQTGPAIRNDDNTINKHLDMLKNHPDLQEIYQILSRGIKLAHK